jgi:hypothetical protein
MLNTQFWSVIDIKRHKQEHNINQQTKPLGNLLTTLPNQPGQEHTI